VCGDKFTKKLVCSAYKNSYRWKNMCVVCGDKFTKKLVW